MMPCLKIASLPSPLKVTLPGGATLLGKDLSTLAQPALAPLMPVFDIIDAVVAIVSVLQAIPDALGPPPDPTAIASKLPELSEKLGKLLGLVPQVSLPLTVAHLLDGIVAELERARSQLVALKEQVQRIALAVERASQLGDPDLTQLTQCASDSLSQETANVGRALAALGGLIGILRILLGLIGGPTIPDLSSLDGVPLDDAIAIFDEVITAFRTARQAIPIP
jgi:hypothetical protein